jgi:hypothetical protein
LTAGSPHLPMNSYTCRPPESAYSADSLRLEAVTTCVGFADMLDVTLKQNHPQLDTMIVVTSHDDRQTQAVAQKHGAICVQTDLFKKNGRNFNKGAAINAGMARWQYYGWHLHIDADTMLPDNARRLLLNHTALDPNCIYGADRVDVIGRAEWSAIQAGDPQHLNSFNLVSGSNRSISHRYIDPLRGYVPIGFFQLWNARCEKPYPWSLGTAAHDDVMFAEQWPAQCRRHLPTLICYHLVQRPPMIGENWDGNRRQPRLN